MGNGLRLDVLGAGGSYAGPGEACSGYLLRSPGATVVLDLGPGTLANLQRHVEVGALDAVVLSHEHPDHWTDLLILRNAMRYYLGLDGLAVYGTAGVLAAAHALSREAEPTLRPVPVDAGSVVEVGDLRLSFSRTQHPVETLAVRAESGGRVLLYSADTGPGWDATGAGGGVHLFLCEATVPPDHEGDVHLSGRQAGALARSLGVDRLVVTHVPPGADPESRRSAAAGAFGGPTEVAVAGASFTV